MPLKKKGPRQLATAALSRQLLPDFGITFLREPSRVAGTLYLFIYEAMRVQYGDRYGRTEPLRITLAPVSLPSPVRNSREAVRTT